MPNYDPEPQRFEFPGPRPRPPSSLHLTESQTKGWGRNQHIPGSIWRDGKEYFSIRCLASAWSVSRGVATRWAKARPHLMMLYEGRYIYFLDQAKEDRPPPNGRNTHVPPSVLRDGVRYYSVPELARRRGTKLHSTRAWVKRHPHLALRVGKHNYCRDEEFGGLRRLRPSIQCEGRTYWNIPELARQRGVDVQATRRWAAKHPHLT